jgi:MOSC domain-containing protein YiiM
MADETREVVPNKDMIRTVIKDKRRSPEEYTWFIKTVLSHLYRTWYARVVETGQVRPSDVISTTDEAYALVTWRGT